MKKLDVILIAFFLLIAMVLILWINASSNEAGEIIIYKDGQEFASAPLNVEKTVIVEDQNGGRNVVRIENGQVQVIEANCKDQICVHSRPAKKNGQAIICLPNKVVIEVRSTKINEIDGVSE
ncbi:MAG: NusG domain II-containing protein [Clostridiaceae bacterium]|jgi:hypothetical protein|nr:NusG domain II-containing protein [Clostridiaceae bacterium]